jgi:hypothetical protein
MTPRLPPENPDDNVQSELLQAVHTALNDLASTNDPAPTNDPVEEQPLAETRQDVRPALSPDETEVEIDRFEAYLRGPTAFTA